MSVSDMMPSTRLLPASTITSRRTPESKSRGHKILSTAVVEINWTGYPRRKKEKKTGAKPNQQKVTLTGSTILVNFA